uniref:CP read-through protein n=1 Tax=Potato leafroll virus TaxID=12045 RepID=A0A6B9D1R4_PLRV|nr:CP read-through protein [Potato leafroll virus]
MLTIQARENDDQIILGSLGSQRMKYIEDENQNYTNISSEYYSQSSMQAVPMYYFNVPKGQWSVDISCEGYQPTSSTSDPNRGRSDGMIAYSNADSDYWNVGEADGVKISKLRNDNTYRQGHPELEINSCHFREGQLLERDATISFHVEAPTDGRFFLVGPAIQKTAKYNYTISYGDWTDRDMELGLITVVLDEHLEGTGSANRVRRPPREGHTYVASPREPEGKPVGNKPRDETPIQTQERQPDQTPSDDVSDAGSVNSGGSTESLRLEFGVNSDSTYDATVDGTDWPRIPPPRHPPEPRVSGNSRIVTDFSPKADLLENWDAEHFDPGYSKEDVAAATIIAHGSIQDGRSMLEKREENVKSKTSSWKPPLPKAVSPAIAKLRSIRKSQPLEGGTLKKDATDGVSSIGSGSLTGGTLKRKVSIEERLLQTLTTEQRLWYENLKKTDPPAATQWLFEYQPPPQVDRNIAEKPFQGRK